MNHHIFIYGLTAIAAVAYFLVFGFGPLFLVVWAYAEWKRKDEKKEKGRSEEVDDEFTTRS